MEGRPDVQWPWCGQVDQPDPRGLQHHRRPLDVRTAGQPDVPGHPAREHGQQSAPESIQVALRQLNLMENYLTRFFDIGKAFAVRREISKIILLLIVMWLIECCLN